MAEYVEKVHVADDIYLNFADCSPKAGHLGAREYLFAKAVGSDAMMHHAASDYAKYSWREEDNNYNLFYMYLALTNHDEIMDESKKEHIIEKPSFTSFPGLGLGIDGPRRSSKGAITGKATTTTMSEASYFIKEALHAL